MQRCNSHSSMKYVVCNRNDKRLLAPHVCPFYFLIIISVTVTSHHDYKQLWEDRICFILQVTVRHPGKSSQKVKAGTGSRKHKGMSLLPWLVQLPFLHSPGPYT